MSGDAINPNVPVLNTQTNNEGTIEVNSGGGPVSFDELEQVTREAKKAKSKEDKPEKSKDLSSDENKGKTEKTKESKESKPEVKESKEVEQSEKPQAPRKTIKAKYAENEYELDEETLVPVTVNGQEEMWTLKELRADKSGKTAWDKKFQELDKFHRSIKSQDLKLQETAQKLAKIFKEEDPAVRLYKMAEIAGVDPTEFQQKFYEDNIPLLEKWYTMSDDEKRAWKAEQNAKHYKSKADTLEAAQRKEEAQRALRAKVDTLRASHQISEDEFLNHYDQVKEMVANGELEAKVTPEYVIETVQKSRLYGAAEQVLQNLNLLGKESGQKLVQLVDKAYAIEMSPKELAEWVDENWGTKKAQKVVEEKKQDRQDFISGKKEVQQAKSAPATAMFFDEI